MPVQNLIQLRKGSATEWSSQDPILASGEPGFDITNNVFKIGDGINTWSNLFPTITTDVQVYVKNTTGNSLTKGQAVYINGAQGNNATIELSIATNESGSSKTLGLLKQNLGINEFGYVISEGTLDGIDTSEATTDGDTIWLSPSVSGGRVYGSANKPLAPNHMVFLGYVLRKQANNGRVYIKVQNGFELGELHNVSVNGTSNGQFLQYNSSSGIWLASNSGNFTTLQVNNTGVSVSGHSHLSTDITDFNESVDDRVSNLLIGTSGINISYNDAGNTLTIAYTGSTGGGGGTNVTNYADNRIITSDGTSTGLNAENNLTYDGSLLTITGAAKVVNSFDTSSTGTIIGINGTISQSGQTVLSQGYFSQNGDAQHSQYLLRNITSNNSWTPLKNNGFDAILLTNNRTYSFTNNIIGRSSTSSSNAAYKLEGLLYHDSYGVEIIGTPIKTIIGEDDSSWDIRVSISGAGVGGTNYLLTEVSGSNSHTINWLAKVDLLEVGTSNGVTPTPTQTVTPTQTATPTVTPTRTYTPTPSPTSAPYGG